MIDLPRTHGQAGPLAPPSEPKRSSPISGQSAWETLVHETPTCVGLMDTAGRYLFANPVLERTAGVAPGGLSGRSLDGLVSRAAMQQRRQHLRWVIEQRSTLTTICVLRGVCWKVTMKPVSSPGLAGEQPPIDSAEDEHHASHQVVDSLAAPEPPPQPAVESVLCTCVRLAHAAACLPGPGSGGVSAFSPVIALPSVEAPLTSLPVAPMLDLGPLSKLTPRELQVLRLVGLGLTIAQMARRVHRAEKTLEWHRNALGTKLEIRNRVHLARLAIEGGFTALSDEQMESLLAGVEKSVD